MQSSRLRDGSLPVQPEYIGFHRRIERQILKTRSRRVKDIHKSHFEESISQRLFFKQLDFLR